MTAKLGDADAAKQAPEAAQAASSIDPYHARLSEVSSGAPDGSSEIAGPTDVRSRNILNDRDAEGVKPAVQISKHGHVAHRDPAAVVTVTHTAGRVAIISTKVVLNG